MEIQQYFGGIGSISITSTRNEVTFSVQDMKSITSIIIPHFDNYPLESAKKVDYNLWKQCIKIRTAEETLTQSRLEQIIAIKGAINLGLSDKLKLAFPDIKVIPRPEFIVSDLPLNSQWVSGFTAGDACFAFSISKDSNAVQATYQIHLHVREEPLLIKIQEYFGLVGHINSYGAKTSVEYKISRLLDLNSKIITHFDKYPLSGTKLHNYLIWREMVVLFSNKAHLTPDGKAKLIELKSTLNKI